MKENKKYYKVVSGSMHSCMVEYRAEVQYKIGEYVEAPEWLAFHGYHLLVFNNLEDAIAFHISYTNDIFECKIKDKVEMPEILFYHKLNDGIMEPLGLKWPKGTVMVKQVMLTNQVEL